MSLSSKFTGLLVAVGLGSAVASAPAQGSVNALDWSGTVYGSPTTNAIGWAFTPTTDIIVTAILGSANQVSFWSSSSVLIASFNYSGPYGTEGSPPASYEAIEPLSLVAGQEYFIFAQNADQSTFFDYIFGSPSGASSGENAFSIASSLTYEGSYTISTTDQWTPTLPPPDNANYLLLGPSFQFTVVPEPSTLALLALGAGLVGWQKRRIQL